MVIFTSSSKLASLSLNSVDFEACTVKMVRFCSTLENVSPLERRVTSLGAAGGAFFFSICLAHPRCRYTATVTPARSKATVADQRAYRAASFLLMLSVKQNFGWLYRMPAFWNWERQSGGFEIRSKTLVGRLRARRRQGR